MKRNMKSESGSSDEEKTSLKKAKKENIGNGEVSESDNTELIDGSKKGIANRNVKIKAPLAELKDLKGLYAGNPYDQKFVKDKAENDGDHENGSIKEMENRNDLDIIHEMELINKHFIIGRYSKEHNCNRNKEVDDVSEESIYSEEEAAYVDGNIGGEVSMSSDEECTLLADKLTRLFRSIYYDTRDKRSEKTVNKCQAWRNIDDSVDMTVINKGKSYSSIKDETCSEEEFNKCYDWGETSGINYETNDEGLGKEVRDYSSENDIRNESLDASNNSSFGVRNSTNIKSEESARNAREESKNICNSVINDGRLVKKECGDTCYDGVQADERANRNGEKENEIFADCQSNGDSKENKTSDEESDSITDMAMRNGEGKGSSSDEEVNNESDNSDLISYGEASTASCGTENNSSFEGDSTELDMNTDEEYSWNDNKSSSYEETDSSDKEVTDETSTDQSSDTSSVEDDSTDNSSSESTDEEYNSSNGSEDSSDWSNTDEILSESINTSYDEEIESDESSLGNDGNANALFSYRNNKEITYSGTEEENSFDCANGGSIPKTGNDLRNSENIKNREATERWSEANDSAEIKSSDDEDLARSSDDVLGFLSRRRFSIRIPGEGTISVCVTSLKLMSLNYYFRESVDGRRKKRAAAERKDIKTPSVGGNNRNGKTAMRGRGAIKNNSRVQNKAAEMSDSEELSDEETEEQVRNNRGRKRRSRESSSRKSSKQIEQRDSSDDDNDEDYDADKGDEDSSDVDGEDNGEALEDEEEEDYSEDDLIDSEDIEEEEYDEEDEERDVDEAEEQDSEDGEAEESEENGEENEVEDDVEDVDAQVEDEDDSDGSSENEKNQRKQAKSKTIKKKETKDGVRGKSNLTKRGGKKR